MSVKKNIAYGLMVPGFVLILFFLMLPLISTLWPTIFDGQISFSQYTSFFTDEYYVDIFTRTLKISLITTLVCMLLGVPTAYFISRCSVKWKGLLIAVSLFPLLTNSVVRSFAWINILGKNGIVNQLLLATGIVDEAVSILYTEFSVIIGMVYIFLPIMILTLVGVMDNIDNDMMEAAQSLGANKLKSFAKVVLPMSVPGMITGAVLVFTGALTAYTTPQLLGGNEVLILPTLIYQRSMAMGDWTGASVIAAIMIVTTLVVMQTLNFIAAKMDKRGEV